MSAVVIETFRPADQDEVRALILEGLQERWGALDPSLNRDLDDISATYRDHLVLVARDGSRVVGTGTLRRRGREGEIVRMAVATNRRGRGIGRALVEALAVQAGVHGIQRLVLETTATWVDAVTFYEHCGFTITHEEHGEFGRDVYLARDLGREEGTDAE
jgi:ribosomal protein S18 acetylase RimI-like enzyme